MAKIQLRRGTTTEWSTANPTLALGEVGVDTVLKKFKIGDGSTAWNSLAFTRVDSAEKIVASGTARTFYVTGPTGPTGASAGDIWIKTS
jgi:hypothetical protein